jgi:hypothetical protein
MNFEHELQNIAKQYIGQGFHVVVHPGAEELPPFARDFRVEIVGRRGDEGVLVAVKKTREAVALDTNMPRYAEATAAQPGWRFDFVVLEGAAPTTTANGAHEFSAEDIGKALRDAAEMNRMGYVRAAVISAWAGLEAAMRMRLRAAGEKAAWGTTPREMLNELYSSGILSVSEFHELGRIADFRNQTVHGFRSDDFDADWVSFLNQLAQRLTDESLPEKRAV